MWNTWEIDKAKDHGGQSQFAEQGLRKQMGGVPGLHTCTKLLSKMGKSRSWSNSPLRRWRWRRPGRHGA